MEAVRHGNILAFFLLITILSRWIEGLLRATNCHPYEGSQICYNERRNLWSRLNSEIWLLTPSIIDADGYFSQVFVFDDADFDQTLDLINTTSEYALTGAMCVLSALPLFVPHLISIYP